jgi:prepilin-type processing-associated H-X9-DG protein
MLSMIQYAGEHDDAFPDSLGVLLKVGYINSPKVFFCPDRGGAAARLAGFPAADFTNAPLDQLRKIDDLADYVLVKGVKHTDDANTIVVHEKDGAHQGRGRNCAFNDGHIQWLPEPVFQQAIKKQQDKLQKNN